MCVSAGNVIILIVIQSLLTSVASSELELKNQKKEKVVFALDLVPVKIKRQNSKTGAVEIIGLNLNLDTLLSFNITKEQFETGILVDTSNGDTEVRMAGGRSVPINLKVDEVIQYKEKSGKDAFSLSKFGLMSRSMADLKDPSLIPEKLPNLRWHKHSHRCNLSTLRVSITQKSIRIQMDDDTVVWKEINKTPRNNDIWWDGQGLSLVAINPNTCLVTFDVVVATGDFGNYRDLIWALNTIKDGNLIVISSLRDGSLLLGKAIERLAKSGSFWAPYYSYKDGWINVFFKGGKTITESLVPNLGLMNVTAPPVSLIVSIPSHSSDQQQQFCYSSWPSTEAWRARRNFCENYDGYGQLCDCENPFVFKNDFIKRSSPDVIPLVIIAGRRPRHLYRLIESVGNQDGVGPESFLIAVDGSNIEVLKLTYVLQLQTLLHGRGLNVSGTARIASNLQFALFNALKIYQNSNYFILLEEDLILAVDFYRYMTYLSPIFEMDKSIFCVSAYNHLSFPHTSRDPAAIYRVNSMPAYGWMVSKSILRYLLPKILPDTINQDWDYFLGSELIRQDREILIPDINRSFHWATAGLHLKGSWVAETHYLTKELNKETNVDFPPLQNLMKPNYEKEFTELLKKAIPLRVDEDFNFKPAIQEGLAYALYVSKVDDKDEMAFRFVGDLLGIWSLDFRDHHNHVQRLFYKNATLFIVGVPISPYSIYMPKKAMYISATNETKYELEIEKHNLAYSSIPMFTHNMNYHLPSFYFVS